ncbi:MAG: stage III sporulation protein AD [Bacillota bacterium]
MEIIKIVGFALIATIFLIILRKEKPEIAVVAGLAAGAAMLFFVVDKAWQVVKLLQGLAWQAQINPVYFRIILKVVGVAYVAGFGAQICKDAGEGALAMKIEMAGKMIIILMAVPVLSAILKTILQLL